MVERSEKLLRMPQVTARVGLKRAHVYTLMDRGDFPQPVKLGPRAVAWVESEIDQWIRDRIAESRGV